ncbi:MAG: spore coat protein CotJB [Lachnospiraceae bacterium]|nr:spore coat protein CotJB [Lachnospiraceae bacterium]
MSNKEQLLNDIGIVSFVLVELGLYLDTHPTDRNAMEYFNHYNRIKHQMVKEFSMKYYPLTMDMAESNKEWRWGAAPLPWEGACE